MDLKNSDIERVPSFGGKLETDFIEGMGKVDDEFVVLLNIDRVLSLDNLNELADTELQSNEVSIDSDNEVSEDQSNNTSK